MSDLIQRAARFAGVLLVLSSIHLALAVAPARAASRGPLTPNAVPTISVSDATVTEGQSGAKIMNFTVSLSAPSAVDVYYDIATRQVSAIGSDDFQHAYGSGVPIFAGQTTGKVEIAVFGDQLMESDETFELLIEGATNATVGDGVGVGTIIDDDAGAAPTLVIGDAWITEGNSGGKVVAYKVRLSQAAATDVSFAVASANGTASAGSDYTAVNLPALVIPAGQLSTTFNVTVAGDTSSERDETFRLNLSNASGATIGRGQALVTIANDDALSASKIWVSDVYLREGNSGAKTATFYVNLTQASASTVTFDIRTEDSSATAGSDYVASTLAGQSIPAGQTTKSFTVSVNGDTLEEAAERFLATLSNVANASLEYNDPHGVATIGNDDATLSIGDVTQLEGTGNGTAFLFPVNVSSPLDDTVSFQVETFDGTATAVGGDYNAHSFSNWQVPAGATTANVVVWVGGDTRMEPDETFGVRISGAGYPIKDNEATGTILNDDAPPFPTLYVNSASVAEGNAGTKVMNFIVTMSEDAFNPVSFDCWTTDLSAQGGSDYVAIGPTHFEIPTGQTQGSFPVTLIGDTVTEIDEVFYLSCGNPVGGSFANGAATGTILNDDIPTVPALSIGDVTVTEGATDTLVALPITLSAPTSKSLTLYLVTLDGTALKPFDYYTNWDQVSIPAGETSATYYAWVRGDYLGEGTEQFVVRIASPAPEATLADGEATVTVLDDDGPPAPDLSVRDVTVWEGSHDVRSVRFMVTLSQPAATPVTFNAFTQDGTATGLDFSPVSLYGLTIPAGETFKVVSVPVKGDPWQEDDEYFFLELTNVSNANPLDLSAKATIRNDDLPAGPKLSISDASVVEGNAGEYVQAFFTLSLSQPAPQDVAVAVSTTNESASDASDYAPIPPGTRVFFPAGQTSASYWVWVSGDAVDEPDETFVVTLSNPEGGASIADGRGVGTIQDDDAAPGPGLSIADVSVVEGAAGTSEAVFTVALSAPAPAPVVFDIATVPGTAAAGIDFGAASIVGKTIPAGQTSTTFAVAIHGDAEVEADETFSVHATNLVGAAALDPQARGRITNDDLAVLSIADATVAEGDEGNLIASFVVSLSRPMPTPVSFSIATGDLTATAGDDYVARSEPARLLDPGRSSYRFEVLVRGDAIDEADETFEVTLGQVVGAVLGDGTAIGTVQDDDATPVPISAVQGTGATSPMVGRVVTVEGVVTALAADGFFLQSAEAGQDADPATAEGLFVIGSGSAVMPGDRVRVGGRVQEQAWGGTGSGLTGLAASAVDVLAHGQPLPSPVRLENAAAGRQAPDGGLERFEGMRVAVSPLAVTAASGGRIDARSQQVRGDGRFHGAVRGVDGPHRLRIESAAQRGARALAVDVGDVVTGLVGVLGEREGVHELLPDPDAALQVAPGARPVPATPPTLAEATLGTFNLRRFFDASAQDEIPAMATAAYATRLAKTANAICAYARAPAILAVQDIEGADALEDLAAALNSQAGNVLFPAACAADPGYVALPAGARSPRGLGLLVSTTPVRPGVPRAEARSVQARAGAEGFVRRDGSREPLFQAAPQLLEARIHGEGGESIELAVLVVQSGRVDAVADESSHGWPTRADYLQARGAAQGAVLAREIQAQRRAQPRLPLVVLGDFEALPALPGMVDVGSRSARTERYTVVRDGRPVDADRALVSDDLAAAARVERARVNADFGEDNLTDPSVPVRVSDHDPMVLYLRLR